MKIFPLVLLTMLPGVALADEWSTAVPNRPAGSGVVKTAKWTAATPAPPVTSAAKGQNIYVAIRTDGVVGAGTQANPYNGSTEAGFDAVIAGLWSLNTATPITVHLGPGIYTITPVQQVVTTANPAGIIPNLNGNVTIVGAGENKTTVRAGIVSAPNATYYVFFEIGGVGGASFENLTIDCNMQNQTAANVTIDGVASNNWGGPLVSQARYVHVIDGGNSPGQSGNSEWFGISIHDFRPGANGMISNCLVDHYQGQAGCTAVSASNTMISNTVVLNANDPYNLARVNGGGGGGFQNAFSPAHLVRDNFCHNCTMGIYSDVGNPSNVIIENNQFDCLYEGIYLYNLSASSTASNITIDHNVLVRTYMQAITIGCGATTTVNSNFTITNNTLLSPDVPGSARVNQPFAIIAAADCVIEGNTISTSRLGNYPLPTAGSFTYSDMSTFQWADNRYVPAGGDMAAPAGVPATN
jgi:hypothetical protein